MLSDQIRDIWEMYGLKSNPFMTDPILVRGGLVSIDSFVGRTEHIKRINKIIGSNSSSRVLVFGDAGVGKTSFVNFVRHNANNSGFFTPYREIAVHKNWSCEDFIYNTLSDIYLTLKLLKDKPIDDEIYEKLESFLEIGMSDKQYGVSIASIGGNYGAESKDPTKLTFPVITCFFEEVINNIEKHTQKSVILHYNNLELIPEEKLRCLFDDLRDFFQMQKVHFIFVGNLTVQSVLLSMPRFSSIMNDTTFQIESLELNEISEILNKRLYSLKIGDDIDLIIPYTSDVIDELYRIFDGNIRDVLNSLNSAIVELTYERPIILDMNKLVSTLNIILEKTFFKSITQRGKDVLMEVVKRKEITNKSISDNLHIPSQNVSKYLKDLKSKGCIRVRRKDSMNKFWCANPQLKWILLKTTNKSQKIVWEEQYVREI